MTVNQIRNLKERIMQTAQGCFDFVAFYSKLLDTITTTMEEGPIDCKAKVSQYINFEVEPILNNFISKVSEASFLHKIDKEKIKTKVKLYVGRPAKVKTKDMQTDPIDLKVWYLQESARILQEELSTPNGKKALLEVIEELKLSKENKDSSTKIIESEATPTFNKLANESNLWKTGKGSEAITGTHLQSGELNQQDSLNLPRDMNRQDIFSSGISQYMNVQSHDTSGDRQLSLTESAITRHVNSSSDSSIVHPLFNSMKPTANIPEGESNTSRADDMTSKKSYLPSEITQDLKSRFQISASYTPSECSEGSLATNGFPKQLPPSKVKIEKNPFLITDANFPAYRILQLCLTDKTKKIVALGRTNENNVTVHIFRDDRVLESSFDLNGEGITPLGLECIELVTSSRGSELTYDLHILYYFKEKHYDKIKQIEKDRISMQYILPTAKKFKSIICCNYIQGKYC